MTSLSALQGCRTLFQILQIKDGRLINISSVSFNQIISVFFFLSALQHYLLYFSFPLIYSVFLYHLPFPLLLPPPPTPHIFPHFHISVPDEGESAGHLGKDGDGLDGPAPYLHQHGEQDEARRGPRPDLEADHRVRRGQVRGQRQPAAGRQHHEVPLCRVIHHGRPGGRQQFKG